MRLKKYLIVTFLLFFNLVPGYSQDNMSDDDMISPEELEEMESSMEEMERAIAELEEAQAQQAGAQVSTLPDYDFALVEETLLNQDPDPAEAGDYVEVRFLVTKSGNELKENIEYELVEEYPFSVAESDSAVKNIGNWRGNPDEDEYYILHYKLEVNPDAKDHTYDIELKRRTGPESDRVEVTNEYEIRVDEKDTPILEIGNVITSPHKLMPDYDEAEVMVNIVNMGTDDAEQVQTRLHMPDGFSPSFGNANQDSIGTIIEGNTVPASFYVDVEDFVDKGEHNFTLDLKYVEDRESSNYDDRIVNKNLSVPVRIFGKPMYDVTEVTTNPESFEINSDDNEVKLSIENTGTKDADTVSIIAQRDSSQPFEFDERSVYIGEMKKDDTGEAVFRVDVDSDAEVRDHNLRFTIRSVVDDQVLTEEKTVKVSVEESHSEGILYLVIGGVIFLVMMYFVYMLGINKGRQILNAKDNEVLNNKKSKK